MASTATTNLNILERKEFLLDTACKSNLNFAVISSYRGVLNREIVEKGLSYLQQMHPNLQITVNSIEKVTHFIKASAPVPLREYSYKDANQWREVVRKDLAERFTQEKEPLWRVSFLRGSEMGQLILTFHHGIADGVCGVELPNHLFSILSELLKEQTPTIRTFDEPAPEISSLYPLSPGEPSEGEVAPREDFGHHTNYVKGVFDVETTAKVLSWTKEKGIKVNGTLFAAFLLAVRRVINPPADPIKALTIVNYRSYFNPPVSKEVVTLLRTGILSSIPVTSDEDLGTLARSIHQDVHARLAAGEHIANIKVVEKQLARNISPKEMWQSIRVPDHGIAITNVGAVTFQGEYDNLSLQELFFVANVETFIDMSTHIVLGAVTFKGKIFPTIWFIDELVEEAKASAILLEMEKILSSL